VQFFGTFPYSKVIDSEGNTLPTNTPGELVTRGYSVMLGYWNQPEETKKCLVGFFATLNIFGPHNNTATEEQKWEAFFLTLFVRK
jgi:acyl-coenzyme A synthetase/AMP-(fatty) acid ligase